MYLYVFDDNYEGHFSLHDHNLINHLAQTGETLTNIDNQLAN